MGAPIKSDNGLIKVIFKPAKQVAYIDYDDDYFCEGEGTFGHNQKSYGMLSANFSNSTNELSFGTKGLSRGLKSGLTVLGDRSFQRFSSAEPISEYDTANITEINTRILCENQPRYRPLMDTNVYHSNQVPPKIDSIWNNGDAEIEDRVSF
jgi:hypothetical protein